MKKSKKAIKKASNITKGFYGDYPYIVCEVGPWALHGGNWNNKIIFGNFAFSNWRGVPSSGDGSRLESILQYIASKIIKK